MELATRGVEVIREERLPGDVPLYRNPRWRAAFPWLIQGTTGRGEDGGFDLRLSGAEPAGEVLGRWRAVRDVAGCTRVALAHQVHGTDLLAHDAGDRGIFLAEDCDGHLTNAPGVLLAVTVADCVPIFVVDPSARAIALLHAGWRGAAGGILERGVEAMAARYGSAPAALHVHLGPAICGRCYEVGPEVHEALGLTPPDGPAPVDLRTVLARRAERLGIAPSRITVSAFCTRCDGDRFFSHRGGSAGRQIGVLGLRTDVPAAA